jgi:hypothetical protein
VIVEPGPYPSGLIGSNPGPKDRRRLEEYGGTAHRPAEILERFESMYRSHSAPDPTEVAEAVVAVMDSPADRRPLRTVVHIDFGVRQMNAAVEPLQRQLIERMGLPDLLSVPSEFVSQPSPRKLKRALGEQGRQGESV